MESKLTIAELVNRVHVVTRRTMPLVTDVNPRENTVEYTIGYHRFVAMRDLTVLEIADGKLFYSDHAKYQQGRLRGGKRDDAGTLIVETDGGNN